MYPQAQEVINERRTATELRASPPSPSGLSQSIGSLNERLLMLENTLVVIVNTIQPTPQTKDKVGSPPPGLFSGVQGAHDTLSRLENIAQGLCDLIGVVR